MKHYTEYCKRQVKWRKKVSGEITYFQKAKLKDWDNPILSGLVIPRHYTLETRWRTKFKVIRQLETKYLRRLYTIRPLWTNSGQNIIKGEILRGRKW